MWLLASRVIATGEPQIRMCEKEMVHYSWMAPKDCLERAAKGEVVLPPPQVYELTRISQVIILWEGLIRWLLLFFRPLAKSYTSTVIVIMFYALNTLVGKISLLLRMLCLGIIYTLVH